MDISGEARAPAAPSVTAADYIRDIEERRPFAYAKINHGMWDGLVRTRALREQGVTDPEEIDRQPWALRGFQSTGFCDELNALVRSVPRIRADIRLAASAQAFPHDQQLANLPAEPLAKVEAEMTDFLGPVRCTADAMLWKHAVLNGDFPDLCRALRKRDVVVIGPASLRHFGAFAGLPRCRFLQIDGRNALLDRQAIAEQVRSEHRAEDDVVYLVQAGPLSAWLILTLAELASATFIDLGIVMDLASMSRLKRSGWGAYARGEMAACIRAVNPGWPDDPRAHDPDTTPEQRSTAWKRFSGGILPEIAAIAGLPERTSGLGSFDRPALGGPERARFVEEKLIDWQRVHEILELSRRANQWTNSGPVSHALERAIEFVLHLPPERAVVACASASVGLTALAGLHAVRRGRPLRWMVSAYTFAVQRTGIFADAAIVDCDDNGMLDLDQAANVPDGQWDGMVVTNVFASLRDLNRFSDFCRARGKALIVDSAGAMFGIDRRGAGMPAEAISFHHTKPWGVGEGGCIIVDRTDVPLVRAALNFGIGAPEELRRFSGNGKISEVSCALILDRLERLPGWRTFYMGQRNRIRTLARREGLRLLCKAPRDAVLASIPVLAPSPIGAGDLVDRPFDMGKYYPPLSKGFPNAARIFGHIVNVPCHAGMAAISRQTIVSVLREFAERPPACRTGMEQAVRDRCAHDIEGGRPVVRGLMIGVGGLMQRVAGRLMGFGRSGT